MATQAGMNGAHSQQIIHRVDRPDFDFAGLRHGIGAALHPGEGFFLVSYLTEPETSDELVSVREGAVDDRVVGPVFQRQMLIRV